jgi:mRNA-degrading endonuclease YafQ of YafQ-DinJ toxin-antitoxin module
VKIRLTGTFRKDYRRLPKEVQGKADKQLRFLMENPKHPSLKIHRIEGTHGFWEFYVDRFYRGIYTQEGDVLVLRYIGPHDIIEKV